MATRCTTKSCWLCPATNVKGCYQNWNLCAFNLASSCMTWETLFLHDVGDTLQSAYFCNTGLISILSVFPDGKSVEVGLVGKEGFIGSPLIAGFRTSPTQAVAQIEGNSLPRGWRNTDVNSPSKPQSRAAVAEGFANHGHVGDPDC